ncbi:MAG: hypothetical protein R3B90_19525 [Planctomycetaceae bacterium]
MLATSNGESAMGVVGLPARFPAVRGPSYGRFRFKRERVTKWNCVYRLTSSEPIPAEDYRFRMFVVVGTRPMVERTIDELTKQLETQAAATNPDGKSRPVSSGPSP